MTDGAGDLSDLRGFGHLADEAEQPCTDRWGALIVPAANCPRLSTSEGVALDDGQTSGSKEAGPAAGSGAGRRAPATASATAHPVESWLIKPLGLEEVAYYHPDMWWETTDSGPAVLTVPLRLFESLPYRAVLYLEVPTTEVQWIRTFKFGYKFVPPVRAWAFWEDGRPIRAHHENPDGSICACMPADWGLNRPLEDFISFCACWVGKCLHARELGRWPGPQHHPPWLRILRDRPDEYCGCDAQTHRPYAECCRNSDLRKPFSEHLVDWFNVRKAYYHFLRARRLRDRPRAVAAALAANKSETPIT